MIIPVKQKTQTKRYETKNNKKIQKIQKIQKIGRNTTFLIISK